MTLEGMTMGDPLEAAKSREEINIALTRDQCLHGFGNTALAIQLWLMRCDRVGRKLLLAALAEDDKELDGLGR